MVNYLAVLVATVVAFGVGALWYTVIFGKQWKHLMGLTDDTMRAMKMSQTQAMIGGFLSTFVLVYVLALLMQILPISTAGETVWFAFLLTVGFIGTTQLNSIWYEDRPWKLYFINASHYVVAVVAAALVLFYW